MNRSFLLLRYTLILAAVALLVAEHEFAPPPAILLLFAVVLASNVALAFIPHRLTDSTPCRAGILLADTAWITVALLYSGRFNAEFFYLYFFVLLLAAVGESLLLIALAAIAVCGAYAYVLSGVGAGIWSSPSVIRIPFLFTTAAFYGYFVDRIRSERRRAREDAIGELEGRVEARTAELRHSNQALANEIAERRRAERAQQEEAEVFAAQARFAQQLICTLGTPAFLDTLCRTTAQALQCDCSYTLLWHPEEGVYVPIAAYGATPEEDEIARVVKVPRQAMSSLFARLEHGDVAEVRKPPGSALAGPEQPNAVRFCIALRRGKELIGVQVARVRGSMAAMTEKQRRIAGGIAQIGSLALQNSQLLEKLERSNRVKSEFVATMSHELRSPLHIIIGYNDMLCDEGLGPLTPQQTDAALQVGKSARDLLDLINAVLDLSRLEDGRLRLNPTEISVSALLGELIAAARQLGETPDLEVLSRVEPEQLCLRADRAKLKMALWNLIANATKFTPQGSVIVSAEERSTGVEFSVVDTGPGIAPEAMPIIFQPFRQADGSMSRGHSGVGLGLYVVRRLLDLMGGTIKVESEVGRGSTFRVWVPRDARDEPATDVEATSAASVSPLTVLDGQRV